MPPIGSVIDETDDAGGHRIYLDPWASEREAGEAEGQPKPQATEDRAG